MWSIARTAIFLHALVARTRGTDLVLNHTIKGQDFTDTLANKLVDKLVDKLLAPSVAIPHASRPTIPGRTLPSSLWAARTALAPRNRLPIVPNAAMDKAFSGVQPEAINPVKQWPANYRSLLKRGLKPVTPQEALKMMQSPFFPAKLVDIRLESQFVVGHSQGAINVPLFRLIQGNSVYDVSKRLLSYSLAIAPTERNPDFQAEALKQLNRNQPIIIACDRGGIVENIVEDKKANEPKRYTSSLKAAYELYEAGFKKLFILDGGLNEWDREGFPLEGEGTNPILSAVLGSGGATTAAVLLKSFSDSQKEA